MTDLYKHFITTLENKIKENSSSYSLNVEVKDNIKTYYVNYRKLDDFSIFNTDNLSDIIEQYYQNLINPNTENQTFIKFNSSQFGEAQKNLRVLMYDYQIHLEDNHPEDEVKKQFNHIFEVFFESLLPNSYHEVIEGIARFYGKEGYQELTHMVLKQVIDSIAKQEKHPKFADIGEIFLIQSLPHLLKLDFNETHYNTLKKFFEYHDYNEIKDEKSHLNQIAHFIKEKISLDKWYEFEQYTYSDKNNVSISKNKPIFSEKNEGIYTIDINLDSIKLHYKELSLASDAKESMNILLNVFLLHCEKLNLRTVIFENSLNTNNNTFHFISKNEETPDKILINKIIHNFLDYYSDCVNQLESVPTEDFQDIINFSIMDHRAKNISHTNLKKKI